MGVLFCLFFFLNWKVEASFLTVRKIGGAELTGAGDL